MFDYRYFYFFSFFSAHSTICLPCIIVQAVLRVSYYLVSYLGYSSDQFFRSPYMLTARSNMETISTINRKLLSTYIVDLETNFFFFLHINYYNGWISNRSSTPKLRSRRASVLNTKRKVNFEQFSKKKKKKRTVLFTCTIKRFKDFSGGVSDVV